MLHCAVPGIPFNPCMIFRILGLLIVLFWGVMTWQLVNVVYFPSESRLAEVDPGYVMGLFLGNGEPSELHVFNGVKRDAVGLITLAPRRVPKGETHGVETRKRDVRFSASGMVELPKLPRQTIRWTGNLRLDEDREIEKVNVSVSFADPIARVAIEINARTGEIHYQVRRGGVMVTDSKTDPSAPGIAQLRLLMAAWGVDADALETQAREQEKSTKVTARHGNIEIAGNRFHAYILIVDITEDQQLKFYFTDDGELVKVVTFVGYEALSEVLAPNGKHPRL